MKYRIAALAVATVILSLITVAEAQQAKKIPRIGLLRGTTPPLAAPFNQAFQQGLRELGYEEGENILIEYRFAEGKPARTPMKKMRIGALFILRGPVTNTNQPQILKLAAKNRLPTMSARSGFAEAGGLMFYGVNDADLFRRAAVYVDKILKGAKPADLPVEQPMKFELTST